MALDPRIALEVKTPQIGDMITAAKGYADLESKANTLKDQQALRDINFDDFKDQNGNLNYKTLIPHIFHVAPTQASDYTKGLITGDVGGTTANEVNFAYHKTLLEQGNQMLAALSGADLTVPQGKKVLHNRMAALGLPDKLDDQLPDIPGESPQDSQARFDNYIKTARAQNLTVQEQLEKTAPKYGFNAKTKLYEDMNPNSASFGKPSPAQFSKPVVPILTDTGAQGVTTADKLYARIQKEGSVPTALPQTTEVVTPSGEKKIVPTAQVINKGGLVGNTKDVDAFNTFKATAPQNLPTLKSNQNFYRNALNNVQGVINKAGPGNVGKAAGFFQAIKSLAESMDLVVDEPKDKSAYMDALRRQGFDIKDGNVQGLMQEIQNKMNKNTRELIRNKASLHVSPSANTKEGIAKFNTDMDKIGDQLINILNMTEDQRKEYIKTKDYKKNKPDLDNEYRLLKQYNALP